MSSSKIKKGGGGIIKKEKLRGGGDCYQLKMGGGGGGVFLSPLFSGIVLMCNHLHYRHLIPAPVDRISTSAWSYKHPWMTCQKNKPITPMTHAACESKLRSVVRSSAHPSQGNWMGTGRAVVYYARAGQAFSA